MIPTDEHRRVARDFMSNVSDDESWIDASKGSHAEVKLAQLLADREANLQAELARAKETLIALAPIVDRINELVARALKT